MAKHDKNDDLRKQVRQQAQQPQRSSTKPSPVSSFVRAAPPPSDAIFYRIERRLSFNARHNCLSVMGALYPASVKGRSKRGWTTPKVA